MVTPTTINLYFGFDQVAIATTLKVIIKEQQS